ncbi:MAG: elongation factor G [Bacteroidales bacterium]|jgi:elongation factor G|nr:elongation factor G [Bacteroidales bacterium]
MKVYNTNQIKNFTLLGNTSSGKTTLAEAILFEGKVIERRGEVENKNTVSDHNEIERENGSSVYASVLYAEFNEKKLNFIDPSGSDDFVNGAVAALSVTDIGVLVLNAQHGIEVGTEIHNRYLEKAKKGCVLVINQLDHEKSNFDKVIEEAVERLGKNVTIIQYPINEGPGFDSFIDILLMKKYSYAGGKLEISDVPADQKDRAEDLRNQLIEKAAENDEGLMEIFFENGSLSEDEMRKGITMGLIQRGIIPVVCVSAKKNYGVARMMEFFTRVFPSPNEVPAPIDTVSGNEVKCDASGPAAAFIFKSAVEQHLGEVNYFKVMSGEISEGMDVVNSKTGNKERISQLFVVAGKNRTKIAKMVAGDIGSTVKLKGARTGQTLAAPGNNVVFAPIPFPEPKYRTAIKAINESDEEKLNEALQRLNMEDPTILVEYSKELKQTVLSGQGEYHLNILKWHLDNVYKISTEFIAPKIPYRETITKVAQADYRHKKQSGGAGQFGEVHMVIEPYEEGQPDPTMYKINGKEIKVTVRDKEEHILPWGGKLVYYNSIVGGSIDARFMPAILKGIMEKMEEGPLTGSYARDIRVTVYDGKMHPVDSNEISFRLAGRNAFREAFKNASPKIMEPIYNVEVWVPADRMGDVMSDLQTRRAIVQGMTSEKGFEKITARVPLSEMNRYSTSLSSITGGRAMYSMKFAEYAQVPGDIQTELIKTFEAESEDE